jgi:DNA primase catalytic subunit
LPDDWESTVKVAMLIVEFLQDNGVKKSAFVKWSGNGAHVHLNSSAISDATYRRIGSLNVAYAVVEFVIRNLKPRLRKLVESTKSSSLSVENKIDPKRVFTSPLSLHRSLFRTCVCILPEDLEDFQISWTNPRSFKHNANWIRTATEEGDSLAELAYSKIGPCPYTGRLFRRKNLPPNI